MKNSDQQILDPKMDTTTFLEHLLLIQSINKTQYPTFFKDANIISFIFVTQFTYYLTNFLVI